MGLIPWKQLGLLDSSYLIGCLVALLIELITLVRVILGSRHKFVLTILAILIGANLAYLAKEITYINMINTGFPIKKYVILFSFGAFELLLFNVGHWMFAHKYFTMSRQAPHKLSQKEVPRGIVVCDEIINWVFLSLNALPPVLYFVGVIGFY